MRKTLKQRFLEKVYYALDGCWYWIGYTDVDGYGRISLNNISTVASRVSFIIHNGDPGTLYVCHSCDNPTCVNPDHLYAATQKQNVADCFSRGRGNRNKGETHGGAALALSDVIAIRANVDGLTQKQLGEKYGVGQTTISRINIGKTWRL